MFCRPDGLGTRKNDENFMGFGDNGKPGAVELSVSFSNSFTFTL